MESVRHDNQGFIFNQIGQSLLNFGVTDIIHDASVEKSCVLQRHAEFAAQTVSAVIFYIHPVCVYCTAV